MMNRGRFPSIKNRKYKILEEKMLLTCGRNSMASARKVAREGIGKVGPVLS